MSWFLFLIPPIIIDGKNICIGHNALEASVYQDQNKNTSTKARWAIIALVQTRPDKLLDLRRRNTKLMNKIKPYANLHNITFIFFSESIFPSQFLIDWENYYKGIANVRIINTAKNGFNSRKRFGYEYMCKFFGVDVYQYLKDDYEYYMRCDTDCFIKEMEYDVFQWTKDQNVGYGFSMRKIEAHQPTRETISVWTEKYSIKCNLQVL